jgi:sec-independent protein translocase protein TatC
MEKADQFTDPHAPVQAGAEEKPPAELPEMTLREHLLELRKRLMWSVIAIAASTCIALYFVDRVFPFFTEAFHDSFKGAMLIGTSPAEAFLLKLKMAFFTGLLGVSPFLFFQLWLFIRPALYEEEKRMALPFVMITTSLFLAGVVFCYQLVLPIALEFFAGEYESVGVTPTIRISEHIAMVVQALLGFGIAFELPVISFLLARLGVIDFQMMKSGVRYAIVVIFLVSAILTPPDVLSQFLMAGPLTLLYGVSMLVVKHVDRRGAKEQK